MPLVTMQGLTTSISVTTGGVNLMGTLALSDDNAKLIAAVTLSVQGGAIYLRSDGVNSNSGGGIKVADGTVLTISPRTDVIRTFLWSASGTVTVGVAPLEGK